MLRQNTFDTGIGHDLYGPDPVLSQTLAQPMPAIPAKLDTACAIERLCDTLVSDKPGLARRHVARLRECDVGVHALIDSFVPGAAARLGEMWTEDTLGFAEVTVAMTRLTDIYRDLSHEARRDCSRRGTGKVALFALTPGENHSLGLVMAADRFERAGWAVRVELRADAGTLARIARTHRYDLIGLSAGSRRAIPALTETIAELRRSSDETLTILVGGHVCVLEPAIAAQVGADSAYDHAGTALAAVEARSSRKAAAT